MGLDPACSLEQGDKLSSTQFAVAQNGSLKEKYSEGLLSIFFVSSLYTVYLKV